MDPERPTPIFLLSLPRSGSTLVQRVLASLPEIATTSEPWLLLPHFYTLKQRGIYAEFNHTSATNAIGDFYENLPEGRLDYIAELREFALRLYAKASPLETRYFLDKTPRYHLISDELLAAFPDAKFVFLWRNPLAVAASMIETWGDGRWNLYRHKIDLYDGLSNLVRICEANEDRVHQLRYEDFLTDPERAWKDILHFLDLQHDGSALREFGIVNLRGRMGDPSGIHRYDQVDQEPLTRWRKTMNSPFRKHWCRSYLNWIGPARISYMGYDLDELLDELDSIETTNESLLTDVSRSLYGVLYDLCEPKILRHKLQKLPSWRQIHTHK